MPQLKLAPTRSNLLLVQERLRLAREGHRLLDRKREVLVMEIMRMIDDAERVQAESQERFAQAYLSIEEARVAVGTERLRRIALSRPRAADVQIKQRSVMGVAVPDVSCTPPERRPLYGFGNSSVVLDQAEQAWGEVLGLVADLAEKATAVWRLALELRRTQRRVNALKSIFIPAYEESLRTIRDALEEKDREDLFRLKRAKARLM
jgi:V/A-type H+-transporting ATPase subunit D